MAESTSTEPSTPAVRVSTTFSEGYGDFTLQSTDNVVFHISKFLLAYASPVFSDMFELAPPSGPKSVEEGDTISKDTAQVVKMTEDAHTLDQMLRHIDPKQTAAPLNEISVGRLLEAARKYQLGTIMDWFESECMKHVEYPNNPTPGKSLMARNPLLVLALAAEYEMPLLAQQSICAIVGGEPGLLQKDVDMPLKLYRYIYGLREARIQWYMQRIGTVASKRFRGKPVQPAICMCSSTRSSWIHEMMETVFAAPTWKRFTTEVNSPLRRCKPGCGEWASQVEEDMMVWSHEAGLMESTLPSLPS